ERRAQSDYLQILHGAGNYRGIRAHHLGYRKCSEEEDEGDDGVESGTYRSHLPTGANRAVRLFGSQILSNDGGYGHAQRIDGHARDHLLNPKADRPSSFRGGWIGY